MKRVLCMLLCAALLATGCAGLAGEEPEGTPYNLYFLASDLDSVAGDGALQAETIYLQEEETNAYHLAKELMQQLLRGPESETMVNPIPAGTSLDGLKIQGSRAEVDLSSSYRTLSGVALTLADYAITLTLTQIPEIVSVRITVQGQELAYRGQQIFTSREVLLAPQGDVVSTVEATLYFLNGRNVLVSEERTLELYEGDTQVIAVARALENGPEDKELKPIVPEGFRLKSVWVEEETCYVNLSSALLKSLPEDTWLSMTLRGLAYSLCSLEAVEETRFLVDGELAQSYGPVNIEEPFSLPR